MMALGLAAACAPETAPPQSQPPPSGGSAGTAAQAGSTSPGGSAGSGGALGGTGGALGGSGGSTGGTAGSGGALGGTGGALGGTGGQSGSGKPLHVIDYSPYRNGQAPGGGNQPTVEQVREDLEILKPLVDGVRIYGTDGGNAHVPALCDELGIDLHVGAWIDGLASDGPNVVALAALVNQDHPSIKTAVIGNEVLNRTEDNGLEEVDLIAFIDQARAAITVDVPIAAAETYPRWMEVRPNLAAKVDVMIWHTYGWWAGADIADAAALVASRYQDMLAGYPGKVMYLGETGWPSQEDNMSEDLTSTAVGSEENQARYYRELKAILDPLGLQFWPFSAFDEQWKAASGEGEVGAHWGIFNADRTPKMYATELMGLIPPP